MVRTLGITGGIGSGKSAVCQIMRSLGAEVFNADAEAKVLMEQQDVREEVIAAFGTEAYNPILNRAWLAAQVFGDADAVARLNSIVHPRVQDAFLARCRKERRRGSPLLVHEAALTFESGSDTLLDCVVVVDAPIEVRIQRVMDRDGVTEAKVRARMGHQMPAEEMRRRAHRILDNSGSRAKLQPLVERLFTFATQAEPWPPTARRSQT